MKNTIYNDIQSLFKSGEIQTIKFSKTGRVTVKFKKEPHITVYENSESLFQILIDDAKLRESLDVVKMKPKVNISVSEIEKLNIICEEVGIKSLSNKIPDLVYKFRKSRFERFYDSVTNFLSSGKSFAPNELKSFR